LTLYDGVTIRGVDRLKSVINVPAATGVPLFNMVDNMCFEDITFAINCLTTATIFWFTGTTNVTSAVRDCNIVGTGGGTCHPFYINASGTAVLGQFCIDRVDVDGSTFGIASRGIETAISSGGTSYARELTIRIGIAGVLNETIYIYTSRLEGSFTGLSAQAVPVYFDTVSTFNIFPILAAGGDVVRIGTSIGSRHPIPELWAKDLVPANQAETALEATQSGVADDWYVNRAGVLTGGLIRLSTAVTAGTLTIRVKVDKGAPATVATIAVTSASGTNINIPLVAFTNALDVGDLITVTYQTDAGFLPDATMDIEVGLEVQE
jgi:hypothetical protein